MRGRSDPGLLGIEPDTGPSASARRELRPEVAARPLLGERDRRQVLAGGDRAKRIGLAAPRPRRMLAASARRRGASCRSSRSSRRLPRPVRSPLRSRAGLRRGPPKRSGTPRPRSPARRSASMLSAGKRARGPRRLRGPRSPRRGREGRSRVQGVSVALMERIPPGCGQRRTWATGWERTARVRASGQRLCHVGQCGEVELGVDVAPGARASLTSRPSAPQRARVASSTLPVDQAIPANSSGCSSRIAISQ